jgi:hypothetical protein
MKRNLILTKLIFLFFGSFGYTQSLCIDDPKNVFYTIIECSRTANYNKLRLLLPPSGDALADGDALALCNPGKTFGRNTVSKSDFEKIHIEYKNAGSPAIKISNRRQEKAEDGNYYFFVDLKMGEDEHVWYIINVDGCWYLAGL